MFARRVQRDTRNFLTTPPEFTSGIHVDPTNMRKVYFRISGIPAPSPYEGGEYIVRLDLPEDYPMMPPNIVMLTPTGRFIVGSKICTSFTAFHKDSWTPMYDFTAILRSFVSFMLDDEETGHVGYSRGTDESRRKMAAESAAWNQTKQYTAMFT
jgi:ubiquitin-conjugating enzyme E2 J2